MNHIVDTSPLTKFEGGRNLLHEADDDTVIWLESVRTHQWRRQDFVTGGSEVWVCRGSRVRSPPEADTFTAMHREFVGFGTV